MCIRDSDYTLVGAHILKRHQGKIFSVVKKVTVGQKAIIGARSNLGPGANIPDDVFLPAHSRAMLGRIERSTVGKTSRT